LLFKFSSNSVSTDGVLKKLFILASDNSTEFSNTSRSSVTRSSLFKIVEGVVSYL
jgi:hypothetical protein